MAWQRQIPFGYEIRGGQLRPHPQEADAVRYIFGQYLAGASLLAIAEDMTGRGPRYHQHTPEWNKHMVKRILENAKYVGAGGYPRLVSDEDFAAAQGQRGERNTYAPLPAEIRPIQGKAVCGLCGATLARGTRSHGTVHWKCQNPDCGQNIAISDGVLAGLVDKRLRELAQAPHLLTAPEPQRAGVDMDAVRLQNELTLALNRGGEPSVNAKQKMSIFAEIECHFSAVSIAVYTALIHHFTCRLEACQALIYQLVSGLTGENGKYNYSIAVHVYPPFFDIPCSAKNYKIAPALTPSAYIKTLALAVTAQRYGQLPDPTPAHDLELLRARLEEGPADASALAALLAVAVRAVRLTPAKTVELELVNGQIITEEQEESA